MDMTLNKETQDAFNRWLLGHGATYHPCDIDRFNEFAKYYCKGHGNIISEKEFIKEVKRHTRTTKDENRGIAQKFFRKLTAIQSFCKSNDIFA